MQLLIEPLMVTKYFIDMNQSVKGQNSPFLRI